MDRVPCIPESAPFTPEQRLWLNGCLAGLFSDANAQMATRAMAGLSAAPAAPPKPLVILYGSQTGTAEGLAKKTAKEGDVDREAPAKAWAEGVFAALAEDFAQRREGAKGKQAKREAPLPLLS